MCYHDFGGCHEHHKPQEYRPGPQRQMQKIGEDLQDPFPVQSAHHPRRAHDDRDAEVWRMRTALQDRGHDLHARHRPSHHRVRLCVQRCGCGTETHRDGQPQRLSTRRGYGAGQGRRGALGRGSDPQLRRALQPRCGCDSRRQPLRYARSHEKGGRALRGK